MWFLYLSLCFESRCAEELLWVWLEASAPWPQYPFLHSYSLLLVESPVQNCWCITIYLHFHCTKPGSTSLYNFYLSVYRKVNFRNLIRNPSFLPIKGLGTLCGRVDNVKIPVQTSFWLHSGLWLYFWKPQPKQVGQVWALNLWQKAPFKPNVGVSKSLHWERKPSFHWGKHHLHCQIRSPEFTSELHGHQPTVLSSPTGK